MIPIGPLIAAALIAGRVGRRRGARSDELHWNFLVWIFVAPWMLFLLPATIAGSVNRVYGVPTLLVLSTLLFPWFVATQVAARLRLPRLAYAIGVLSDGIWYRDHRGGGAIAGALALLRSRKPNLDVAAWIERRLARGKKLQAGGIVAGGLLAAARGDLAGARSLLATLETIDPKLSPKAAHRLAGEWLAADAAGRGDWRLARELGTSERPRSAVTRFLGLAASRLRGDEPPASNLLLWWRWAIASHPAALWPLLRRAFAAPRDLARPRHAEPLTVAEPTGDRVADALALHALAVDRGAGRLSSEDLSAVGKAWDAAREDAALQRWLGERSLVLGCHHADRVVEEVARAVEADLVALAREAAVPLEDGAGSCQTLARAARQLRNQLLGEIELTSERIRRRVEEARELPPLDEWRELTSLYQLCRRAATLGGLELRRLAFPTVHADACKLAVWLWDVRKQRLLGNSIFRWLLDEACAVDDTRAIELEEKNVAAGV